MQPELTRRVETSRSDKKRVILGAGLLCLDVVIADRSGTSPRFWAGGTCGNVLTILSYLGWRSFPIARLGNDTVAKRIARDMRKFEVDCRYLEYDSQIQTPLIIEKISGSDKRDATHRFSWVCPNCGNWFPRFRPMLLREAMALGERLPQASCFLFDRVSAASLHLAKKARERGTVVVFEPPSIREDKQFQAAMACCDILKYSNERAKNPSQSTYESSVGLVIETLGAEGLRFRLKEDRNSGGWKSLPAFRVKRLRDAAGAGDWCTAGIIDVLTRSGNGHGIEKWENTLIDALRYGQALSALNCGYEGARGAMYALKKGQFNQRVAEILCRKEAGVIVGESLPSSAKRQIRQLCPGCRSSK